LAQDLTYRVTNNANKKEKIVLLNKVTGFLLPGHLSALVRSRRARRLTRWIVASPNSCCKAPLSKRAWANAIPSGAVRAAQMGPSGSSKTTLLGERLC
jgi:hypothetical protein